MLYPINIKTKKKSEIVEEEFQKIKNKLSMQMKEFVFDKTKLKQKILMKLHV